MRLIRQHDQPPIFKLPTEIIDIILTWLEPHDSACFVLSCKRFYQKFRSILRDERLQDRQSYSGTPFIQIQGDGQPRAKLIRRLETPDWRLVGCT